MIEFNEIDVFVNKTLKEKYGNHCERRDYRELEKRNPTRFEGYGNSSGLMYLVDVSRDTYIDINIRDNYKEISMVFRKDDNIIIIKTIAFDESYKQYLLYFIKLVDEYKELMKKFNDFRIGTRMILRDIKLEEIIKN